MRSLSIGPVAVLVVLAALATAPVLLSGCASSSPAAPPRPTPDGLARTLSEQSEARARADAERQTRIDAENARQLADAAREQAQTDSVRATEAARLAAREVRYAHGTVNVRSGPGTSSARVAQLGRDDTVLIEACESGWCRVASVVGDRNWSEGYVSQSLLHEQPASSRASSRTASRTASSSSRSQAASARSTGSRGETCDTYASQAAAQSAYNADPVGLSGLDGDGDGEACESTNWPTRTRSTGRARTGRTSSTRRARAAAPSRTCYTGPRGGRYYINSNGNRVYGC